MAELARRAAAVQRAAQEAGGPVPSPCVSVCRMNAASGLCEGCLRTLDEIAAWGTMSDAARCTVWLHIGRRAVQDTHPT
ncbi:MAG: DUF1289 domain-containing protein [Proteobacteria bacterium]|nr:DUF1289 domain-containing protein [Pseudomonadota bacterium]